MELRSEKKRPMLLTYGISSEHEDLHKLDLHSENIANNLLRKEKRSPALQAEVAALMSVKQIEGYAKTIKAVCRAARTKAKKAVVNLPVSAMFHAVVTLPKVKKEDFNKVLKAEVKKLLPRPLEEMALDYQVLPASKEAAMERVLINAVPLELIAFYTKIFQRAGLALEVLESGSAALARALVGRDRSLCMIIDIGAERTNFFIVDESVPVTHQSIEIGGNKMDEILQRTLGVENSLVTQIKYDLGHYFSTPKDQQAKEAEAVMQVLLPAVDPIVKEIEYGFEVYLRQSGNEKKRPEKIILTGGASFLPNLTRYIENKFKVKCYVGDPWARVVYQDGLKPLLHQIGPRMAMAIGLALRNMV